MTWKICDVSRKTINAIENYNYVPTLLLAFKLSKELHITVDELFEPEDRSKREKRCHEIMASFLFFVKNSCPKKHVLFVI